MRLTHSNWKRNIFILQQKQDSSTDVGNRTFEEMVFTKNGTVNSSSVFIDRSTYFLYMEQWIETFSRENVLIIDGDEFKVNQILALKDTESFLNLEHFITKDQFHFNEDKGFYCLKTIKERMNCLGEGKGRPHPDLKPDDKIKLQNYFAPYNKKFFQLIRRTLNWWLQTLCSFIINLYHTCTSCSVLDYVLMCLHTTSFNAAISLKKN